MFQVLGSISTNSTSMGSLLTLSLSKLRESVSNLSLKRPATRTSFNSSVHNKTANTKQDDADSSIDEFYHVAEESLPTGDISPRKEKVLRFKSYNSCVEYSSENGNKELFNIYRYELLSQPYCLSYKNFSLKHQRNFFLRFDFSILTFHNLSA